jgi:hypothetical protein
VIAVGIPAARLDEASFQRLGAMVGHDWRKLASEGETEVTKIAVTAMLATAVAAGLVVPSITTAHATAPILAQCVVADPTDTPLNVRTRPNGPVLSNFTNGSTVDILDREGNWVFAANHGEDVGAGWVYLPYLARCRVYEPWPR